MPKPFKQAGDALTPFWRAPDGETEVYCGDALTVLRHMPAGAAQCCVTSPPYWGLRAYVTGDAKHLELGCESLPDCGGWACGHNCAERDWAAGCYTCRMVLTFREVRRVLRGDGTLWLNLGDSYAGGSSRKGRAGQGKVAGRGANRDGCPAVPGLLTGNLCGVPWRVALALQADGWVLRQDIIWCLSGGTWVYVRSQKGDMPMMVSDMARLNPKTIKLWNGNKWTQVLGWSVTARNSDELELVLRSGERICCTPTHKFPTARGLLAVSQLVVGDVLTRTRLPEPDHPKSPDHLGEDAAWLAGLYLAEGSMSGESISLAGHALDEARYERVQRIVKSYGGSCTCVVEGNNQNISIHGRLVVAIIRELVSGKVAKNKCLSPVCWRYSNAFLMSYLEGYLAGDGHWDAENKRWRLGFTRNYNLERDMRVLAARLGFKLTLKPAFVEAFGKRWPTFHGEIRFERSGHFNEKDSAEIVEIRKARSREMYDIGVADEPHLFSLASGILTHNSKPSAMPESVNNRCTKAHEYVFLLTKRGGGYFYDAEAIKEPSVIGTRPRNFGPQDKGDVRNDGNHRDSWECDGTSNKRSVWSIAAEPLKAKHYAAFPSALARTCLLAGTSVKGCCPACGAPWRRMIERGALTGQRVNPGKPSHISPQGYLRAGKSRCGESSEVTVGPWQPRCSCGAGDPVPCLVLDPFLGSGTTALAARGLRLRCWGIDLSAEYLEKIAVPRLNEPFKVAAAVAEWQARG